MRQPAFLKVFVLHVKSGEWVTSREMCGRIRKRPVKGYTRLVSQKLANLERYGHIKRRMRDGLYEYSHQSSRVRASVPAYVGLTRWLQQVQQKVG